MFDTVVSSSGISSQTKSVTAPSWCPSTTLRAIFGLWYDHKLNNPLPPADAPLIGAVATAIIVSWFLNVEEVPADGRHFTRVTATAMFKTCFK
jgi:hypothetical protein